jgi:Flp pilus assembly pilin Flp
MGQFSGLLFGDGGQDLIEYGLLASLVSITVVAMLLAVGGSLAGLYQTFLAPIIAAAAS